MQTEAASHTVIRRAANALLLAWVSVCFLLLSLLAAIPFAHMLNAGATGITPMAITVVMLAVLIQPASNILKKAKGVFNGQ